MNNLVELANYLSWPLWAMETIFILTIIIVIISLMQNLLIDKESIKNITIPTEFRIFQIQYFLVFFVIMLADWLQGTNMYTLYTVNSFNI
jgi:hypothetical protein